MRDALERLVSDMLDKGVHYEDVRRELEKLSITRALQRTKGCVGDAADLLGVHRNTVRYRVERFQALTGIDLTDPEARLVAQVQLELVRRRP